MNFEELNKNYPENENSQPITRNEEELLQEARNVLHENEPAVKKGCSKLIVLGIAIFIAICVLAAIIEPYATLDEDGNRASFSDATAICIGFSMAFISSVVLIRKRIHCSQKVTADVIEAKQQFHSKGAMYNAVYEYYFDGKLYRTESRVSTAKSPKANRKVTLRINPNNPREILDTSYIGMFVLLLILGLFVLAVVLVPILIAVFK